MALIAMGITANAQFDKGFVRPFYDMRDADQIMRQNITRDMDKRNDKLRVLSNKKWLLDENNWWTNGFVVFQTYYDEDSHEIGLSPQLDEVTPDLSLIHI